MKLKSLILGSVAAAGLSTAGYAADLGVLTSLDVCDALGLSGLTVSSDTNCLQISGSVSYEFNWGDFNGVLFPITTRAGAVNVPDNDGVGVGFTNDWNSKVEAWLKFVGTADSDFGPAKATIKLKNVSHTVANNGALAAPGKTAPWGAAVAGAGGDETFGWIMDEAFVSVGDTTVIMAGKKGSIANFGDDVPLNWLGLFNSEKVDKGVMFAKDNPKTGGHVIQVVSDLGNGVNVGLGLENLDNGASPAFGVYNAAGTAAPQAAGTLVGVVNYAGEGITAHFTGLAGGVLDGVVENWAAHAGFNGKFDMFEVILAGAYSSNTNGDSYWNVLGSAAATFDIFKIAISGEANGGYDSVAAAAAPTQVGFGGSVQATVTEGVSINLGGRWFDEDNALANTESYQIAAQLVAAVTETLSVSGTIGYYGTNKAVATQSDFYGAVGLDWKPGGGFTSSVAAEAHQSGAYKVTFKAAKSFE